MRKLPSVRSLPDAIREVSTSNTADGYKPARFMTITENGNAPNILSTCEWLLMDDETLEYLENAIRKFPTLLTLEDFVVKQGKDWGFSEKAIKNAVSRSQYFDQLAGGRRYL